MSHHPARQQTDRPAGLRGCSQQSALDLLYTVADRPVATTGPTRSPSATNSDNTFPDWGALFTQVRTPHRATV